MSIVLLNGSTEIRQRNSEGCTVAECGCAYTPISWLQMCQAHFDADHALHLTAQADHLSAEFT